jgi:hypothetical protein
MFDPRVVPQKPFRIFRVGDRALLEVRSYIASDDDASSTLTASTIQTSARSVSLRLLPDEGWELARLAHAAALFR